MANACDSFEQLEREKEHEQALGSMMAAAGLQTAPSDVDPSERLSLFT
eukprot:CAMPEP_0195126278 /NCGR_PEP_ID=MMETSP0448-20130528/134627_1 /TAXON_ID=66468 /ORGANISM="Heterocapsa triquestra, Strain CCMP 448" /LENGTH=47 /DNA_ID= /DNA_START= /DNA_END= /DNA_ORIENTATION=